VCETNNGDVLCQCPIFRVLTFVHTALRVDKISLLILDAIMPGKNGEEVCEEIRRMRPSIKILFTSGYPDDFIMAKGLHTENIDFIAKPLLPYDLLIKVRQMLDAKSANLSRRLANQRQRRHFGKTQIELRILHMSRNPTKITPPVSPHQGWIENADKI
jgi:DNA-binding response OmpR family regulator